MSNPFQFSEPGSSGAVDFRIGKDSSGPPNNWRRKTPPAGDDGSIVVRDEVDFPNTPVTTEQVDVTHPVYPSTFDIPDSEMG